MNDLQSLFEQATHLRVNAHDAEAISVYTDLIQKAKAEGDLSLAADCQHMIGIVLYHEAGLLPEGSAERAAKYNEVKEAYLAAIKEFEAIGNQERVGAVYRDLGNTALAENNLEDADMYTQKSVEILSQTDNKAHLGMSQAKRALVLAAMKKFDDAEAMAREGIKNVEQTDDWYFRAHAHRELGRVLMAAGNKADAEKEFAIAMQSFEERGGKEKFGIDVGRLEKLLSEVRS